MSFDSLFANSILNLYLPDAALPFPPADPDNWLAALADTDHERQQAFFDEQLRALLTVRIPHEWNESEPIAAEPPHELLAFLARLQVSLEATYISQTEPSPDRPLSGAHLLSAPPRTASKGRTSPRPTSHHPSIFPPSTPNPTPATADSDRRYIRSDGTLLVAKIWGEGTSTSSQEEFHLIWSHNEHMWIAIYRLALTVAFLRLQMPDPLLCLTVSTTLRDKPLVALQPKHPLGRFLSSIKGAPSFHQDTNLENAPGLAEDHINGFEEVNLLGGLGAGPTFMAPGGSNISISSARLGPVTRQKLFSLTSRPLGADATSPSTRTPVPTLRKSYRKTLATASGFRVRMRTTFVPSILLPDTSLIDGAEDTQSAREAGTEERTVILCIELENADDARWEIGFSIESVHVDVSGEGASAILIGLGDGIFGSKAEEVTFPLLLHPSAQYNLLYAVSFLNPPKNELSLSRSPEYRSLDDSLRRTVAIDIHGKPFVKKSHMVDADIFYPTHTFSSRWNCVLDLTSNQPLPQSMGYMESQQAPSKVPDTLPEPASPFPAFSPRKYNLRSPAVPGTPTSFAEPLTSIPSAGSKRHTMPTSSSLLKKSTLYNYRASTSMIQRRDSGTPPPLPTGNRLSYIPPSISVNTPRSPAPLVPPSAGSTADYYINYDPVLSPPPPTPAYPRYPSQINIPPSPISQSPFLSHQMSGSIGPSVDIHRQRASVPAGIPPTPGPLVMTRDSQTLMGHRIDMQQDPHAAQSVVISVGLLSPSSLDSTLPSKLYPLDYFMLDIFVYNQSDWTRRFEITYPVKQRKPTKTGQEGSHPPIGILPLDNRVRVGQVFLLFCIAMFYLDMTTR